MTGPSDGRSRLIDAIVAEAKDTAAYTGRREFKASTLAAIAGIDRSEFVDAAQQNEAYLDRPLPIGHGQTISQPFIVALMTDLLDIDNSSRVLEVGTGSGYQAAVLGRIAGVVHTLEIIPPLAAGARHRLARLGFDNVHVHDGNGRRGRIDDAPYDAVIVTAAAPVVPPVLLEQLAGDGNLVAPVETAPGVQVLKWFHKAADGKVTGRDVLPVIFVPLTGGNPA